MGDIPGGVFVGCMAFMCGHSKGDHGRDGCRRCGCSVYRAPCPECGGLVLPGGDCGTCDGLGHQHTTDAHCSLDSDGVCRFCGVLAGPPCLDCGGRSFHRDGCATMEDGAVCESCGELHSCAGSVCDWCNDRRAARRRALDADDALSSSEMYGVDPDADGAGGGWNRDGSW